MNSTPLAVYTAEQVRALDRYAIEKCGVASYTLMSRAGAAALETLKQRWPAARRIVVLCGPGNNGGDGYVLARLARLRGIDAAVTRTMDATQLRGDAQRAYEDFARAGGVVQPWSVAMLEQADVVVDAIFGTGLTREIVGDCAALIDAINACGCPVLALDMPSGLHADSGLVLGRAVRASATVTFIGLKLGFYLGVGPDHTGSLVFASLDAPLDPNIQPTALRIDGSELARVLPPRARTTHKGAQGRVLVVGGGPGMPGAARLAGEAALRVGAGLVTVATRPENIAAIVGARPELICRGVEDPKALEPLIGASDVIAIGPGLGQDEWAVQLLARALAGQRTLVVDADGLNLLAQQRRSDLAGAVLTPHPGEAARLLDVPTAQIQRDRIGAARALAERFRATIVLKGAGSLVVSPEGQVSICDRGNPGMATAGMGDVLTGVIAGLLAQGLNASTAARMGVFVHAAAGDLAAAQGERGLIATDVLQQLRTCVNPSN